MELPDNNPKTAFGVAKPAFHFTPPIAELHLGAALKVGGEKYGLMNWRKNAVTSSVYYDAIRRHLGAWLDGEDFAPDSDVHHLGHVMASCAIILDAEACGVLNDDRPVKGVFGACIEGAALAAKTAPDPYAEMATEIMSVDKGCVTAPPAAAAAFEIGDRVYATFTTMTDLGVGEVVAVVRHQGVVRDVAVTWQKSVDGIRWHSPDALRLAFRVGDIVRCNCTSCRGHPTSVTGEIVAIEKSRVKISTGHSIAFDLVERFK